MKHFLQALFLLMISNGYAKGIDLNRFSSELSSLNKVQASLWNNGVSKKLAIQDQNIDQLMEDSISLRNAGVKKDTLLEQLPKVENSLDKIKKKPLQFERLRKRSR